MKRWFCAVVGITVFITAGAGVAWAQGEQERASSLQMIVSQEIHSQTNVRLQKVRMDGRLNLHLEATEEELAADRVRVAGLNLAYFGIPMEPFTGMPPRKGSEDGTGVLAAMLPAVQKMEVFRRMIPGQVVLWGQLRGTVELSQLGDMEQIPVGLGDEKDAVFTAPTQTATLFLLIVMDENDLMPGRGASQSESGIVEGNAQMFIAVLADPLNMQDRDIPGYVIAQPAATVANFQLTWLPFEVLRRLCIQPVRIGSIQISGGWPFPIFDIKLTGKGLPFGQPGADTQWRKGDVIFEWRPFKTIWKSQYFTLDIAAGEDAALRAEVNDDDCIEAFFVDQFDNPSTWGGGATFSSGLATSKVISSDDNAENICTSGAACNITHLAHEFGHVMTLCHPGSSCTAAHMVLGTSGTLMCPSGFTADNPRRNSVNNRNNVNNPLFQLAFGVLGPAPDCTNDANCGACFTEDP